MSQYSIYMRPLLSTTFFGHSSVVPRRIRIIDIRRIDTINPFKRDAGIICGKRENVFVGGYHYSEEGFELCRF
jgi:hypothetical protein